jgi:hypothetical protein
MFLVPLPLRLVTIGDSALGKRRVAPTSKEKYEMKFRHFILEFSAAWEPSENQAHPKLNLSIRAQGVHAGPVANAERLVVDSSGAVDRAVPSSEQDAGQRVWRKIEI